MNSNHLLTQLARRSKVYFRAWALAEKVYIHALDFNVRPPLLIYQMGKVGSTSVYRSLKKSAIPYPVFHVHWFSREGLDRAEKIGAKIHDPIFDMHFQRCQLLSSMYTAGKIKRLKIITLVRDPVGREISNVFQNIEIFNQHMFNDRKQLQIDRALQSIREKIELQVDDVDYCLHWFDREFQQALAVDVYNSSFDKKKGYSIIKEGNIEILILKLEKIATSFKDAIEEFLDIQLKSDIGKANAGNRKLYGKEIEFIKENLKISRKACEALYSGKYVRAFYSQSERDDFINKWSGN